MPSVRTGSLSGEVEDMRGLQKADGVEHAAIAVLDKIRPVKLD